MLVELGERLRAREVGLKVLTGAGRPGGRPGGRPLKLSDLSAPGSGLAQRPGNRGPMSPPCSASTSARSGER
jgi:hypothetical protein